jgi:hypothetical protein
MSPYHSALCSLAPPLPPGYARTRYRLNQFVDNSVISWMKKQFVTSRNKGTFWELSFGYTASRVGVSIPVIHLSISIHYTAQQIFHSFFRNRHMSCFWLSLVRWSHNGLPRICSTRLFLSECLISSVDAKSSHNLNILSFSQNFMWMFAPFLTILLAVVMMLFYIMQWDVNSSGKSKKNIVLTSGKTKQTFPRIDLLGPRVF